MTHSNYSKYSEVSENVGNFKCRIIDEKRLKNRKT